MKTKKSTKIKSGFSKRRVARVLVRATAALLAALLCFFSGKPAEAVFDETKAVRYSQYAASSSIPDSSLFIGTYIIHINALSDELYKKAEDSVSQSNQTSRYYKSELAGGAWTDITSAVGLSDISGGTGAIVDEKELADLWVTHYVGADGIIHNARSQAAESLFDTPSPYDLYNLPELEPLRQQYDNLYKDSLSVKPKTLKTYYAEKLNSLWNTFTRTNETSQLDVQLQGLQSAYDALCGENEDDLSRIVVELMGSIDSARRAAVYGQLVEQKKPLTPELNNILERYKTAVKNMEDEIEDEYGDVKYDEDATEEEKAKKDKEIEEKKEEMRQRLLKENAALLAQLDAQGYPSCFYVDGTMEEGLLESLQRRLAGTGYSKGDYDDEEFIPSSDLLDAYSDSFEQCQQKYIEESSNALTAVDTVLGKAEYDKATQIIDASAGGYNEAMKANIEELGYIYNIRDDVVKNAKAEMKVIDGSLISAADTKYTSAISAGASSEYNAAVSNGYSDAAKQKIMEDDKAELEAARSQLQYIIRAKTKRDGSREALNFTYRRLDAAGQYYSQIKNDDFSNYVRESVDEHIKWLQTLAREIIDSDTSLKAELTKLQEKKDELMEAKQDALDSNDLAGAAKIDANISAVDKDIEAETSKVLAQLGAAGASESEKAAALASVGSDTLAGNVIALQEAALSAVNDGDTAGLENSVNALAALGAQGALDALANNSSVKASAAMSKIVSQGRKDSEDSPLKTTAGTITTDGLALGADSGAGAGTGTGTGTSTGAGDGAGTGGASGTGDAAGTGTGAGDGTGAGAGAGTGTGTGTSDGAGAGASGTEGGTGSGAAAGDGAGAAGGQDASAQDGAGAGAGNSAAAGSGAAPGAGAAAGSASADKTGTSDEIKALSALSKDELSELLDDVLKDVLGGTLDSLGADGKVVAASAMNRLGQEGVRRAYDIAEDIIDDCIKDNNKYAYKVTTKAAAAGKEYIPYKNIGNATSYRYVYNNTRQEVTMASSSVSYMFTVGKKKVTNKTTDKTAELKQTVLYDNKLPYISEEDAGDYFGCLAEYISGTDYGACLTNKMSELSDQIVEAVKEGG